jgi:hypothetical protein
MYQLTHVVRLHTDSRREIVGLASVDSDRLFVLHSPSEQQVEVYSTTTFKLIQTLKVTGLSDHWDNGLTACVVNNCVYVNDYVASTVYKIELAGDSNTFKWRVDGEPLGLSINTASNLLISCGCRLLEYTPYGSLVREINLKSVNSWHAIQMSNDQFLVCTMSDDVVEINLTGQVVVNYTSLLLQSANRLQFSLPCHAVTDQNFENVFIADYGNNRLLKLNRSLKGARELNASIGGSGLQRPRCLCLNERMGRLYVGEGVQNGQLVVFYIRRN